MVPQVRSETAGKDLARTRPPRFAAIAWAKSRDVQWPQTPGGTGLLHRAFKQPGVLREPLQHAWPGAKRRIHRSLDNELVPTFTFRMMATRNLIANEQILVDYGSDFAALEPYQDQGHLDIGGGDDDGKKDEAREEPMKSAAARSSSKRKRAISNPSTGPMPNTPPCTAPADGD